MKNKLYYLLSTEKLYKELDTNNNGLSSNEAKKRLEKYGLNELPKKEKDSLLKIFFGELNDPIILLLLVSVVISFCVGEVVDAISIIVIILIDLIIGTYEENKANVTVDALSKLVLDEVYVKRDGNKKKINSSELTIGDYIYLESGDKISADIRLINDHNFMVDESALTGESFSINKTSDVLKGDNIPLTSQTNMVFAGTNAISGRAEGIVVGVGIDTEIGKIASSISETVDEDSPLTIRVEKFSKQISIVIVVLSIILMIILFFKGMPFNEILTSVIALAVSAMPEGLPLALTMALTIASRKMAKKKVVTKKLNSVEALGSCTVIATDKTGTLTVNEQTAKIIVLPNESEYHISGTGYKINGTITGTNKKDMAIAREVAKLGVINNEAKYTAEEVLGDSIDIAFLVLGEKMKTNIDNIEIVDIIPYESENKYSAVFYRENGKVYCAVKGSPEVILSFSNKMLNTKLNEELINRQNETLSKEGYRVIAVATSVVKEQVKYSEKDIKDLDFMGMVGFIDPVRDEAVGAINKCQKAGIKVLMITGDHPLTAFKIGKDLKLTKKESDVTTGVEVDEYLEKGEEEFDKFVKSKIIFARVSPMNKLAIVESLKRQGEFVATSGDGVNDAAALKAANIGVAMGSGSDISHETSKMIVLDDNFNSIVNAILEGRVAYANIRKITYFLISCGLAEVLFFSLAIITNMPMPLVAIQLLWLNVVTDGIQDIALSFEKEEKNVMLEKPRDPNEGLFDKELVSEVLVSGITIGIIVYILWYYLINVLAIDVVKARAYVVALMIIIQNIHAFNCRSERQSVFSISLTNNLIFLVGIVGSVLLGLYVLESKYLSSFLKTSSIPLPELGGLVLLGLVILVVMEFYKVIKRNYIK